MYVPVLSDNDHAFSSAFSRIARNLLPRDPRGGGGHGGGSHSSGSKSSSSKGSSTEHSSSSSSSSSGSKSSTPSFGSRGATVPVSGPTHGSVSAVSYGSGTTKVVTIPQGEPFAGRTYGGGTRSAVYGSSWYGSGYPGVSPTSLGVSGRSFPYTYYPVVWYNPGYGPTYLHTHEYGDPKNTTRPGGREMQATFPPRSSSSPTFHVVSDNSTVTALIASIRANCSSVLGAGVSSAPTAFDGPGPNPEQAVQYYRASSVVLTLDGYNNSAALSANASANVQPAPLPGNVDRALLDCLNYTIGESVPMFSDLATTGSGTSLVMSAWVWTLFGPLYLVLCFWYLF